MPKQSDGFTIVSGSSGLLGRAVTTALLDQGLSVVGVDVTQTDTNGFSKKYSSRFLSVQADVSDESQLKDAITQGQEEFGPVRRAVHAAYPKTPNWGTPFEKITPASLRENLFGQLGGAILFAREVTTRMVESGGGSLVLVSSIQGVRAPRFDHYEGLDMTSPAEYTAIKAGVIAFGAWLAKYLSGTHVRVNCVSPGGIDASQPDEFKNRYRDDCLTKGLLDPEDVVGAISFLLSENARYISGQNIVVDDGWSL